MALDFLKKLTTTVDNVGRRTDEFKKAAAKQNSDISKVVRDISRAFSSQSQQQSSITSSIENLTQTSAATSQKVDQTNVILQESISVQNNMLSQLKNISTTMEKLFEMASINNTNQNSQEQTQAGSSGLLSGLLGAGIGGITGATIAASAGNILPSLQGNDLLSGLFGSENRNTQYDTTQIGFRNTGGEREGGGGGKLTVADMVKLAKEAGFSDQDAAIMGAIGAAESSGNPSAHNTKGADDSYGLWQMNLRYGPDEIMRRMNSWGVSNPNELFDPRKNAKAAFELWKEQGFNAWSVYKEGTYKQYYGSALNSLTERDDASAPQGTIIEKDAPTPGFTGSGVQERQAELAGIRKLPLSPRLRSVLDQASAAAGVEAVVYSGGQAPKGSGGPRTGSTRHDHGNAADLYLMKDGRKLSDTNAEDRAIMAKFVSAAVAAGATGVGAGHGYMGPSNIHIGFGKQATWGGAPWLSQAASGVFSNENLASEGGGNYGNQFAGMGNIMGSSMMQSFPGMGMGMGSPLGLLGGMMAGGSPLGLLGGMMAGGSPLGLLGGMMGGGSPISLISSLLGTLPNILQSFRPSNFAENENENETNSASIGQGNNENQNGIVEADSNLVPSTIENSKNAAADFMRNVALDAETAMYNIAAPQQQTRTEASAPPPPQSAGLNNAYGGGYYGATKYEASWAEKLGGKRTFPSLIKGVFV